MRMILWHNMIVHLLAMLIVAAHTLEEARLAPEYSYREESCLDLMPSQMTEANMSSQAGENAPFHAKIMYDNETTFTYKPNHEYRIIISSEDDLFMGFIANMRLARDPTVIVGRVIQPQDNSTLVKTMNCNGTNNTATQMRNTQHTSVEFIWIAPKDLNEAVILRFGVFKNRSLFWNDLHTPCIVPVDINLFPSICPTPMLSSSISSNSVHNSIISSSSSSNNFHSVSMDFSSSRVQTLSLSSSTTFQSMPRSNSVRSSSVTSSFSTQSSSHVLPNPSQSTGVKSEQHTVQFSTTSVFLLSKVLTYTYTSISTPLSTPGPVDVTSTSSDLTKSSSLDVTGNKMTPSPINTATTSAIAIADGNNNILSANPTAVTSNKNGGLLENPSEMMAIGIAVGFVLIIIVSQIFILLVGCFYKRRQNKKSRSRSPSFRTLYSLDTASMRSESIRRSYRAYNRDVDLKLNIIEIDECPNSNTNSSSAPQTEDNQTSNNTDSSLVLRTEDNHTSQTEDNHTSQPPVGDSVASNVQVDVHPTDH